MSASLAPKKLIQQALAHMKKAEKLSKNLLVMERNLIFLFIHFTLCQQSATSFRYQSVQGCKWPGTLSGSAIPGQNEDQAFRGRYLKC